MLGFFARLIAWFCLECLQAWISSWEFRAAYLTGSLTYPLGCIRGITTLVWPDIYFDFTPNFLTPTVQSHPVTFYPVTHIRKLEGVLLSTTSSSIINKASWIKLRKLASNLSTFLCLYHPNSSHHHLFTWTTCFLTPLPFSILALLEFTINKMPKWSLTSCHPTA